MSRRNKLQKFAEMLDFPNVYENFATGTGELTGPDRETVSISGHWNERHFGNDHPLTLELACGRGEYTLALARRFPDRNFIGVDIKGARIWRGAKTALEEGLNNVAFLRTRIEYLAEFFAPAEVREIWITFPDPFPRPSKANLRLTSPFFLERYRQVLHPNGTLHLKTDSPILYDYTLETIGRTPYAQLDYADDDIYAQPLPLPELETETHYERIHRDRGATIKYVRFRLA